MYSYRQTLNTLFFTIKQMKNLDDSFFKIGGLSIIFVYLCKSSNILAKSSNESLIQGFNVSMLVQSHIHADSESY